MRLNDEMGNWETSLEKKLNEEMEFWVDALHGFTSVIFCGNYYTTISQNLPYLCVNRFERKASCKYTHEDVQPVF